MKFKKYPKVNDSGISYIGNSPEHWESIKNKFILKISKTVVGNRSSEFQLLSMGKKGVNNRDLESGKGKFPESFDTYQRVESKNLIFCLFDIDETPRTIGYSELSGMITSAYEVVECFLNIDPKFIYYFYLAIDDRKALRPFYTGLRKVVKSETFLNLKIKIPPLTEQIQIHTFLDNETHRIDSEIMNNKKLIGLLKEKKYSIINETVIKGLNPKVLTKPSKINIIADIPKHWLNSKLKFVLFMLKDGSHNPPPRTNSGIKFLSGGTDFKNSKISFEKCSFISNDDYLELHKFYELQHNDILLTIVATLGSVALVNSKDLPFSMQRSIALLRPKSIILSEFLFYFFHIKYFQNELKRRNHGSVKPGIYLEELKNIPIIHPNLISEQRQIVDYLDTQTTRIDLIISQIESQISYLNEFKRSLIFSTITGKICITN